jgi:hypothetical protein
LNNDFLCFTDGDLAYSFDHIDKLQEALTQFDVVIANRRLIPQHENTSLRRRILGNIFNCLVRFILGMPYRDTQAGLKAFRLHVAKAIFQRQKIAGFAFDAEILFVAHQQGFSVGEIAIRVNDHHSYKKGKVRLLRDSLRMLRDLFQIRLNGARGLYSDVEEQAFHPQSAQAGTGYPVYEISRKSGVKEYPVHTATTKNKGSVPHQIKS